MKKIFLSVSLFSSIVVYCQDDAKLREIDSLVKLINHSDFKITYDSLTQNYPDLGLFMKTYLTSVMNGKELKSYTNKVNSTRVEQGVSKQMTTSTTFYFDQGKLIKVEEYGISDGKEGLPDIHADWYYSDNKILYYTFKSERSEDRAQQLIAMSEVILSQFQK